MIKIPIQFLTRFYHFTTITSASNDDAFLYLRRKYLFGEEDIKLIVLIHKNNIGK